MNRVAQGELEIDNYPTYRMWDYISTNPLQGRSFKEFRVELMNSPFEYEDEITHEDSGKTTRSSNTNTCIPAGSTSACYI